MIPENEFRARVGTFASTARVLCILALATAGSALQGTSFCSGDGSGTACPCGNSGFPGGGCASSSFPGAILSDQGVASVANDTLQLQCTLLPFAPDAAVLFQGTAQAGGGAGVGAGSGLLCVGGSLVRLGAKSMAGGSVQFGAPAGDTALSVRGAIPAAGGTRHYQVWYRDALPGCAAPGFNFSNGLSVTWAP
jgi:hypothetical protein